MRKRRQEGPKGAPDWMVTYGDMVTLLLTFFVLLLTFMQPKEPEQIMKVLEVLRQEFGATGGAMVVPADPDQHNLKKLLQAMPVQPQRNSPTEEESIPNREPRVTNIREGPIYDLGGKVMFPELSAELSEEHQQVIASYAGQLKGYRTQVEVRGHTSRRPVVGSEFTDHFDLSYQRAKIVAQALIEAGVEPERIRISAAGTNRPVTDRAYTTDERVRNDVVEVLQLDTTIDDFDSQVAGSSEGSASPS